MARRAREASLPNPLGSGIERLAGPYPPATGIQAKTRPGRTKSVDPKRRFSDSVPISLRVAYENVGVRIWKLPNPARSTQVLSRATINGKQFPLLGAPLVQPRGAVVTINGMTIHEFYGDTPRELLIPIGRTFEFKARLTRDYWNSGLAPSRWTAWLHDENLSRDSNRVDFRVRFTADSTNYLIAAAENRLYPEFYRRVACEWLRLVNPDADLSWLDMSIATTSEHARLEKTLAQVKAFGGWWQEFQKSVPPGELRQYMDRVDAKAVERTAYEFRSAR